MTSFLIGICVYVATREFNGTLTAALALGVAAFALSTKLSVIMVRLEQNRRHAEVTAKVMAAAHLRQHGAVRR